MNQNKPICRLTVFSFFWACQALVHQEFYSSWLHENNPLGWILTAFAVAVLLFPRSLPLFMGLLISSIVYNVVKWPFVVNHILLESIVNLTILLAIAATCVRRSASNMRTAEFRDEVFDRAAPVLRTMLVLMYYFAFVAKLNWDFLDSEVSAVSFMYQDLVDRFPFLPTAIWAKEVSIWLTIAIEAAIPLLLSFRRTRYLAIALGLPFHFILGLVGHRTFSALAYAIYGLFCIEPLTATLQRGHDAIQKRWSLETRTHWLRAARVFVALSVALLIAADFTGNFRVGLGPLKVYRIPWLLWGSWSAAVAMLYLFAMYFATAEKERDRRKPRIGLEWALVPIVLLNGCSQYLGLKTETCFTMYSNLRTEGDRNNHLFMPALRLTHYQDDLVDIRTTDHPALQRYVDREQLIVYFEFRRILSESKEDVHVVYSRNGVEHEFSRVDGVGSDATLTHKHPTVLAKLLYFRPVFKSDKSPFQH